MTALQTAKKELRKRIKDFLSTVSKEDVAFESQQVTKKVLAMPRYQNAKNISVYLSMPTGEISTDAIVRDAFQNGKGVFVPYFYRSAPGKAEEGSPTSIMDMFLLSGLQDYEALKPDKWGIPSLTDDSIAERKNTFGGIGKTHGITEMASSVGLCLDLILLPGMAFDEGCGRLGHGKGFYDFFMHRTQLAYGKAGVATPYLAGLALDEQLLPSSERVPTGPTDLPVDAVIHAAGSIDSPISQ